MYKFKLSSYYDDYIYKKIDLNQDSVLFNTKEWIDFLNLDINGENVSIIILDQQDQPVGYCIGIIIRKFGVRIFGSPFKGWSTPYMGLTINTNDSRSEIITELCGYVSKELKCKYIEVVDCCKLDKPLSDRHFKYLAASTLELKINRTNDDLFKVFKTDCRNFIRQFERRGAIIEIAQPDKQFAEDYYDQLIEVFAKQQLTPAYGISKIEHLFSALKNTKKILCVRVREPGGKCIATSIYVYYNKYAYFWGAASYKEYLSYRPNEYMIWFAIQYLREQGVEVFDMMGLRNYKKKFGPDQVNRERIVYTTIPQLLWFRNLAMKAFWFKSSIKGLIKKSF